MSNSIVAAVVPTYTSNIVAAHKGLSQVVSQPRKGEPDLYETVLPWIGFWYLTLA